MTGTSDLVDIEATLRHETDKHRPLDFGRTRPV